MRDFACCGLLGRASVFARSVPRYTPLCLLVVYPVLSPVAVGGGGEVGGGVRCREHSCRRMGFAEDNDKCSCRVSRDMRCGALLSVAARATGSVMRAADHVRGEFLFCKKGK